MKFFLLMVFLICSCVKSSDYQSVIAKVKSLQIKSIEDQGNISPNKYSEEIYGILKEYCQEKNVLNTNKYKFPQEYDKIFFVSGLGFVLVKSKWHQDKSGSYTLQYLSLFDKTNEDKMVLIGNGAKVVK